MYFVFHSVSDGTRRNKIKRKNETCWQKNLPRKQGFSRALSISDARDLSVTLPEAYLYFNRAKRIRDWNYFWGGYLGLSALSSNTLSPGRNSSYGVFGLLIGIIVVPREIRRQKLIIKGIEVYNANHSK